MNKIQLQQKLLHETKYSKWYLNIIENAQSQNRTKLDKLNEDYQYYENHHILPISLFPQFKSLTSNPWNGILLTAREHFICHLCITKHYKSIQYTTGIMKMSKAINGMSNYGTYNSKTYQYLKLNLSHSNESKLKMSKSTFGELNPMYGKHHSKETKKKISEAGIGRTWNHSEETKKKISKFHSNRTEEHKNKIIAGLTGLTRSDETKKKMSEAQKGRKQSKEQIEKRANANRGKKREIVKCPHCNKSGGINGMKQFHFDKCKFLV